VLQTHIAIKIIALNSTLLREALEAIAVSRAGLSEGRALKFMDGY
jgi:hypothetical protein